MSMSTKTDPASIPEHVVEAFEHARRGICGDLEDDQTAACIAAALDSLFGVETVRLEDAYALQEVGVAPREVLDIVLARSGGS